MRKIMLQGRSPKRLLLAAFSAIIVIGLFGCVTKLGANRQEAPSIPGINTHVSQSEKASSIPEVSPNQKMAIPHIMLIVLENREYSSAIGAGGGYFNYLAQTYGLASNYYAFTHPSLPNYLELIAGSTFGINSDCNSCAVAGPNLATELEDANLTWAAFFQGMPKPCYGGDSSPSGYVKKHNPFIYFANVVANSTLCNHLLPYSYLIEELDSNSAPQFIWITPNLCMDGHDCPNTFINSFLQNLIPAVMALQWYKENGAIIITFDEGTSDDGCCGGAVGGHVATVVISSKIQGHINYGQAVDTAGLLASIEKEYNLPLLGDANDAENGTIIPLLGNL